MIGGPPVLRDARSAPFFDAAARDALVVRHCVERGHLSEPEARTCAECGSDDLTWAEVSGAGALVSWSVVHHPPHPAFADQVPFAIGLVELAEGPWLSTRIAEVSPGQLRAGLALRASFVHPDEGEAYPVFVPATD